MSSLANCGGCGLEHPRQVLARARGHAFWIRPDGACPACAQEEILTTLLRQGAAAFESSVQRTWPLDARAIGPLPTPLRLRADPRFTGRRITIAIADSGFAALDDLVLPTNRVRAWVDATKSPLRTHAFPPGTSPSWPGSQTAADHLWHGTMTSAVAAGNGFASHGLYRGLAPEADVVLIQLADADGRITDHSLLRALTWVEGHAARYGIRVLSLSVAGDTSHLGLGPIDQAVERLVSVGVTVVAAAGNGGTRRLLPPATAPSAITVGGIDDAGGVDRASAQLWHGNFGDSASGIPKPEIVAPSIWVVAPILPGSQASGLARRLFAQREGGNDSGLAEITERKFVTEAYQHVDGTSFAAPIVAAAVACMLEANGDLTPRLIREILIRSAHPVPGADTARQGAGALDAGRAVALAVLERHQWSGPMPVTPLATAQGPIFQIHDHQARQIEVFGSWNDWRFGLPARQSETGCWATEAHPLPVGDHGYKFRLDEELWIPDPTNPWRTADGQGGINSRFSWPPQR